MSAEDGEPCCALCRFWCRLYDPTDDGLTDEEREFGYCTQREFYNSHSHPRVRGRYRLNSETGYLQTHAASDCRRWEPPKGD